MILKYGFQKGTPLLDFNQAIFVNDYLLPIYPIHSPGALSVASFLIMGHIFFILLHTRKPQNCNGIPYEIAICEICHILASHRYDSLPAAVNGLPYKEKNVCTIFLEIACAQKGSYPLEKKTTVTIVYSFRDCLNSIKEVTGTHHYLYKNFLHHFITFILAEEMAAGSVRYHGISANV